MIDHKLRERLSTWLAAPTDVAGLVAFRVLLGLLVASIAGRYIAYGWVDRFFVQPDFHFQYWGLGFIEPWPPWAMYVHFGALVVLGLCIAAGLFYRVAAGLAFVGFTYLELIDVTLYINHYYLISLLTLLACTMPLGRAGSLDVLRRPSLRVTSFPQWCTALLRAQVATVYFYAGLAKLNEDWLLHGQPLGIWLHARTDVPFVGPYLDDWRIAVAMSWAGFLFDLTIWCWLLLRRTRPYAYAVVVMFHLGTAVLFPVIGMFPVIMMVSALVFFSPSWPRQLARKMRSNRAAFASRQNRDESVPARAGSTWKPLPAWGLAALGLYMAVQLVVPLRHVAYPGEVSWNEQGMRFAWKVMTREKNGSISYFVTMPSAGRMHVVQPSKYLADYQAREMSGQPDLILQLAHRIADDYRAKGHADVEVRAEALVSLNGRPAAPLIDSSVDLAKIPDGVGAYAWVLDAPTEAPPRLLAIRELR